MLFRKKEVRRTRRETRIYIEAITCEAALRRLQALANNPGPLYAFHAEEVFVDGKNHRMVIAGKHLAQPTTITVENVLVGERLPATEYVASILRLLDATQLPQDEVVRRISTPKPNTAAGEGWKSCYTTRDLM